MFHAFSLLTAGTLSVSWTDDDLVPTFAEKGGKLQTPQAARLLALIKFDDPHDYADVAYGSDLQRLEMRNASW